MRQAAARLLALVALLTTQASAQTLSDGLYQIINPVPGAERPTLLMAASGGEGYFLTCQTPDGQIDQPAEQRVVRALGYLTGPSGQYELADPRVTAMRPQANPKLCPASADYPIRLFRVREPDGDQFHMLFTEDYGNPAPSRRLIQSGCMELIEALGLDPDDAEDNDPRSFFADQNKTQVTCLSGTAPAVAPRNFAEWCMAPGLGADQSRTIATLMDLTASGAAGMGDPDSCREAQTTLSARRALTLNGRDLTDLAPLASLDTLTHLSLSGNRITDLSPLRKLILLEHLDIGENAVDDLQALAPLTALQGLIAPGNRIASVEALPGHDALTWLDLADNDLRDLAPLADLPALTRLNLAGNELTSEQLMPLLRLDTLSELDLSRNQIERLDSLRDLRSGVRLRLADNPMTAASDLSFSELCLMEQGNVSPRSQTIDAIITQVKGETELTCGQAGNLLASLSTLDLRDSGISDLSPLATLPQLVRLNLAGNQISDVAALAYLPKLVDLDLSDNAITEARPLARLPLSLEPVLTGNPLRSPRIVDACLVMHHGTELLSEGDLAEITALMGALAGPRSCADAAAQLAQFKALRLTDDGLTTLRLIAELQGLSRLTLSDNPLADVSALSALSDLTWLDLDGTAVADLAPLAVLDGLTDLKLTGAPVTDLRPLARLPGLTSIQFDRARIDPRSSSTDCLIRRNDLWWQYSPEDALLDALAEQMRAEGGNPDDCIAYRDWANSVASLTLSGKDITDLSPFRHGFGAVRELGLAFNEITDTAPLAHLPALERLVLTGNPLRGPVTLDFTRLTHLSLDATRATLPDMPQGAPRLQTLSLRKAALRSLPTLKLPALVLFDLRDNELPVDAIAAMADPLEAGAVRLTGNPVCQTWRGATLPAGVQDRHVAAACEQAVQVGGPTVQIKDVCERYYPICEPELFEDIQRRIGVPDPWPEIPDFDSRSIMERNLPQIDIGR